MVSTSLSVYWRSWSTATAQPSCLPPFVAWPHRFLRRWNSAELPFGMDTGAGIGHYALLGNHTRCRKRRTTMRHARNVIALLMMSSMAVSCSTDGGKTQLPETTENATVVSNSSDGGKAQVPETIAPAPASSFTTATAMSSLPKVSSGSSALSLTVPRNCMSAEVWAVAPDDSLGVGVVVSAEQRSATEPTLYSLTSSQFIAYGGSGIAGQLCSGTGEPDAETLHVVSGSGTLTLDPLGPIPMRGRLVTTELVLDDGTTVSAIDIAATCIGCFPT